MRSYNAHALAVALGSATLAPHNSALHPVRVISAHRVQLCPRELPLQENVVDELDGGKKVLVLEMALDRWLERCQLGTVLLEKRGGWHPPAVCFAGFDLENAPSVGSAGEFRTQEGEGVQRCDGQYVA